MAVKEIVPALGLNRFTCPHVNCGAIAHQTWYKLYVREHGKDERPWLPGEEDLERYKKNNTDPDAGLIKYIKNLIARKVFFEQHNDLSYLNTELMNVHASECFSCDAIAIWRADELVYPVNHISIAPNEGMPDDVKRDFLEANEIIDKSPRGAAALLRLCVQKLIE